MELQWQSSGLSHSGKPRPTRVELKKESFEALLACGTPVAADSYWQAKQCMTWAVVEAKYLVWEKFGEAIETDF